MEQNTIDIVIALANVILGAYLKAAWDSLKTLQDTDKYLAEKLASVEILVAGQYVHKNDFMKLSDALFAKLDKIEDKLDGKADR
jgi:hypothetical protein